MVGRLSLNGFPYQHSWIADGNVLTKAIIHTNYMYYITTNYYIKLTAL